MDNNTQKIKLEEKEDELAEKMGQKPNPND